MKVLTQYGLLLFILFISPLRADIVDVWQFSDPEKEARAVELAKQLRCPQCQNQNLVESTSPIARDLRLEVYQLVEEGKSNQEIKTLMTERFGDFVLYNPKFNLHTSLLWLAPFIMLVLALALGWRYIKARNGNGDLSEEQQRRLQQLLEQQGDRDS